MVRGGIIHAPGSQTVWLLLESGGTLDDAEQVKLEESHAQHGCCRRQVETVNEVSQVAIYLLLQLYAWA